MDATISAEEFARRYGPQQHTLSADDFAKRYGADAGAAPQEQARFPEIGAAKDFLVGAAKGLGHTVYTLGEKTNAALQHVPGVSRILPSIPDGANDITAALEPTNTPQTLGKVAEQVAEAFIPGAAEAGVLAPVARLLGKAGIAGKMVKGAALGAGLAEAQGGNPLVAGVLGASAEPIAAGLSAGAKKLANTAVGATADSFAQNANPGLGILDSGIISPTQKRMLDAIRSAKSSVTNRLSRFLATKSAIALDASDAAGQPLVAAADLAKNLPDKKAMIDGLQQQITDKASELAVSGSIKKMTPGEINQLRDYVDDLYVTYKQAGEDGAASALRGVTRRLNNEVESVAPGARALNHHAGNLIEAEAALKRKIQRDAANPLAKQLRRSGLVGGLIAAAAGHPVGALAAVPMAVDAISSNALPATLLANGAYKLAPYFQSGGAQALAGLGSAVTQPDDRERNILAATSLYGSDQ